MTKPQSKSFREILQMEFSEDKQVRRLERPNVIRFTLDDFEIDVPLSDIKDEGDLLSWIDYLGGKAAMTLPALVRFIRLAADAKQFELFR